MRWKGDMNYMATRVMLNLLGYISSNLYTCTWKWPNISTLPDNLPSINRQPTIETLFRPSVWKHLEHYHRRVNGNLSFEVGWLTDDWLISLTLMDWTLFGVVAERSPKTWRPTGETLLAKTTKTKHQGKTCPNSWIQGNWKISSFE